MKTFICTRENPLVKQISEHDRRTLTALKVVGYLDVEDFELLTAMSQAGGTLRTLDMSGVSQNGYTHWWYDFSNESCTSICDEAFVDSVMLERVILPDELNVIGLNAFWGCVNLRELDIPWTTQSIQGLQHCEKLTDIYLPINGYELLEWNKFGGESLRGTGENYIADLDLWPFNDKGKCIYWDSDDKGYSLEGGEIAFTHQGVLFRADCDYWEIIELHKYPPHNQRKSYVVPTGVDIIAPCAFDECQHLKTLVFRNTWCLTQHAIINCPQLETLVFMSPRLEGTSISRYDYIMWQDVITGCPRLQDIYLFAESPEEIDFKVFANLENLSDIVLHVPCFCAAKFRSYEQHSPSAPVEVPPVAGERNHCDTSGDSVWQNFKRIDEYDPIDVFPELFDSNTIIIHD